MWEWFLPSSDRPHYMLQVMEGGGGGGPLDPEVIGWMWGFAIGVAVTLICIGVYWIF